MSKILIACPTAQSKNYCFIDWISAVNSIDYPSELRDIFIADNSPKNNYAAYLHSYGIITRRIKPQGKTNIQYICESLNVIRDYFLSKDYDYLLMLESDVMIESQTLQTLLFHAKEKKLPVVCAGYFHGQTQETNMLCLQLEDNQIGGETQSMRQGFGAMMGICGNLVRVYASGIGCMLIHRKVLKNISFRYVPGENMHPDTWFCNDLFYANIPIHLDTSIILRHDSQDWLRNPEYYNY